MTDSHCHLEQLEDPLAALQQAAEAGVQRVVSVAEELASCRRSLALKRLYPDRVLAGIGLHPMLICDMPSEQLEACLDFVETHLSEADQLGEVGLDFKFARAPEQQQLQRDVLERQLAAAAAAGRAVNLHSRWALRQTLEVAVEYSRTTGLGAQMHWFTQSKKLVRLANRERVYVSVGPRLLFSPEAREVAATIDPDLLLLETDSPVPFDGEPATPALVARVAKTVAELWQTSVEEVDRRTEANFERFLGCTVGGPNQPWPTNLQELQQE